MAKSESGWLSVEEAAHVFGYSNEGMRRRLRQLRLRGYVVDTGRVPTEYRKSKATPTPVHHITLWWVNPRTFLVARDAPRELLNPKLGRRKAGQP